MEKDNNLDGGILRRIVDVPPMLNKNEYLDKIVISKDHAKTLMPEEYAYLMNYLIPCIDPKTGEVDSIWNRRQEKKYLYIHTKVITVSRFVNSGALKLLMDYKDDGFICDSESNSLLHLASEHGDLEVVDELIERGSNVNRKNSLLVTPLHLAVKNNHIKVVLRLLSNGVDIDSKDKYNCTPLFYAVEAEGIDIDVIRLLMEYDANPYIKGGMNYSPIILAIKRERTDIVRVLLENKLNHIPNDKFYTTYSDDLSVQSYVRDDSYERAHIYAKSIGNKEIIDLFEPPMNYFERIYYITLTILVVFSIIFSSIG